MQKKKNKHVVTIYYKNGKLAVAKYRNYQTKQQEQDDMVTFFRAGGVARIDNVIFNMADVNYIKVIK